MNGLLRKVLRGKISSGRFVLATAGFVVGLLMVLLSLQVYWKFHRILDPNRDFHDYLVLSKEVRLNNTWPGRAASFSEEEIERLRSQSFVRELGVFVTSRFHVVASVGGSLDFSTELFLESVPKRFLDTVPVDWDWDVGGDVVPLIISQDFLNHYNFGYAISRGLPQLSASTVGLVPVELAINGPGGEKEFQVRIAGFSHRIRSILVPEPFMNWANDTIGRPGKRKPSKVIVHVDQRRNSAIRDYMDEYQLRVNTDQLDSGRAVMVLNIATSIVLFVGALFVALSVTIMVSNFAILIADARDEIQLLIQLGYTTKIVYRHLMRYACIFVAFIALATALAFLVSWLAICRVFLTGGLQAEASLDFWILPFGLAFVLLALMIIAYYTRNLVGRL